MVLVVFERSQRFTVSVPQSVVNATLPITAYLRILWY